MKAGIRSTSLNCPIFRSVGVQNCLQIKREHYMPNFPIHTITSTPEGSKSALEQPQQAFGVVPNIAGAIANSPKLVNSPVGVFQQAYSRGLTEQENQIVLLTDAVANFQSRSIPGLRSSKGSAPKRPTLFVRGVCLRTSHLSHFPRWQRRSLKNAAT
jgi:hypothetical protein